MAAAGDPTPPLAGVHQDPPPEWSQALRAAGLRVTRQRVAVIEAVERRPHGTIEDILDEVRADLPTITIQSVYFVMNSLVTAGLVRKLDLPGSPARYEVQDHDNHHHAMCRHCGRIEDIACLTGEAPCLHPEAHVDMTIEVAEVIFTAVCHECASAQQARV